MTTPPDKLQAVQRAPHFDSLEQDLLALLHYLRVPKGTGTAFYRHRATAMERITKENFNRFATIAGEELAIRSPDWGCTSGSDEYFEQIGSLETVPDRLIIYHGSLLHSGIIPKGMKLSADPREGRLTANLFVIGMSPE